MDSSSKLIISCAGSMPWFELRRYHNPSFIQKFINIVWDFKNLEHNNPIGKSGFFFMNGLKLVKERHPEVFTNLEIRWWGSIAPEYPLVLKEWGISEPFQISGFISKEESLTRLNESHVMLLTLALGMNGHPPFSLPGKMFDYLKLGKPILGIMDKGSCSNVLEESGIGVICNPRLPQMICDTIVDLYKKKDHLSKIYQPNQEYIRDNFSYDKKGEELVSLIEKYNK